MTNALEAIGWAAVVVAVFVAGMIAGAGLLLWLDLRGWLRLGRVRHREVVKP